MSKQKSKIFGHTTKGSIKQKTALIALAILLVIAVAYIAIEKYQQGQTQKQLTIYQQGAQAGYQQAIVQLIQQAATCQQVPITFQNQTINMIAVECLQTQTGTAGRT